jgi:peptidylprolyl isomerase
MKKKLLTLVSALLIMSAAVSAQREGIYADFKTSKGTFRAVLFYEMTPVTCANFIGLAEGTISNATYPPGQPFYSNSPWHRVVKGHVIQGGSPAKDASPQNEDEDVTGYTIPDEITELSHRKAGMLGMAHSGPNTATCQYYITLGDRSYLDRIHTVFGEVISGMDVVNSIEQGDTTYSITIIRVGENAGKFIVNQKIFDKLIHRQWKTVTRLEAARVKAEEKFVRANYDYSFITSASGLRYAVLEEGIGEGLQQGATGTFSYTGRTAEPISFSSTSDGKPAQQDEASRFGFTVGSDQLIKGLNEGLAGMKKGEIRLLIIPASLAYGTQGYYAPNVPGKRRFVIPPRRMLIIEARLLETGN